MKKYLLLLLFLFVATRSIAQISLTSGTTGTTTPFAQSFNETRGVQVNVVSATDIQITSMTLHRFFSGTGDTAYVGARIYNPATGTLLASNTVSVFNAVNSPVNVPLTYTLVSGMSYRLSFFCGGPNPPTQNSATEFQPSALPYIESTNSLQIVHAYAYPADTFPNTTNIYVPFITMTTAVTGLEEMNSGNAISVFPNPASQSVRVVLEENAPADVTLKLFDTAGKELPVVSRRQDGYLEIVRSDLVASIYYYILQSSGKALKSGKLILN